MAKLLWCPACIKAVHIVSGDTQTLCRCGVTLVDPPPTAIVLSTALETRCTISKDDKAFMKSIRVKW